MIRIGIICPSEIAFRRFMPALKQTTEIEYVGVAYATPEEWFGENLLNTSIEQVEQVITSEKEKADRFTSTYGGKVFDGYQSMLDSKELDAVYIPLPPALHFRWAKRALENDLHVFVEKPSTTSYEDTDELIKLAGTKKLALHENYMFAFHTQLEEVSNVVKSGELGDVRLYRIDFGFPKRAKGDFRYIKKLGGGALLDCGGYTLKYANMLLGGDARLVSANAVFTDEYDVEIFGAATMCNDSGDIVQIAFGMDNDYRCNIDIWGSQATLVSKRILTAPAGFEPTYVISKNGNLSESKMKEDDAFFKSIQYFINCIKDANARINNYDELLKQEKLVKNFMDLAGL